VAALCELLSYATLNHYHDAAREGDKDNRIRRCAPLARPQQADGVAAVTMGATLPSYSLTTHRGLTD
jgi:hypothetical protein